MDTVIPQQPEQLRVQSPKHFLNKKFAITLVILLLLGSGAYAGIWYWGNYNSQYGFEGTMPTFTPRPSASATPDATAGWKTYTNTKYGYEFNYPADKFLANPSDGIDYENTVLMSKTEAGQPGVLIITAVKKSSTNDTTCEKEIGTVAVAGTTIKKCRASEPDDRWFAFLSSSKADFRFDCWIPGLHDTICEQILSTFKFTDSADTSTWKTYTNTQYGFSFKYPINYILGVEAGGYLGAAPSFISIGQGIMSVSMPSGSYPKNTDFDTAFFNVSVNDSLSGQDCLKAYQDGTSGKILTETKIINGVTFYQGSSGGVGAGHQASDKFFHAYHNGICYELIEGLRTATGGDWVTQQVDGKDVFNKLDPVLNTFKFTK